MDTSTRSVRIALLVASFAPEMTVRIGRALLWGNHLLIRRHLGLAIAIAVAGASAGLVLPTQPARADVTTLYVNNVAGSNCSDAGAGTQAQPYCTVQAAADAAQPGQTVLISGATGYQEQVTVTHSGTAGHPITFKAAVTGAVPVGVPSWYPQAGTHPHAFVLSGVHDVTVQGLFFETTQEAVLVKDSDHVVVDSNRLQWVGDQDYQNGVPTFPSAAPGIRLTGKTTATTVSRNTIGGGVQAGIVVDPGVSGAVITTNALSENAAGGIVVTDAPGTAITSNTVVQNGGTDISLAGASTGSTVENNIILDSETARYGYPDDAGVELALSPGSVSGTKVDYNVVHSTAGNLDYSWGGTAYRSPAALTAATGQGGHDLDIDPKIELISATNENLLPTADSAATDSADAAAPGELDTDIAGNPRVDDTQQPNTGTGDGIHDRGAFELQPIKSLDVSTDLYQGPYPLPVTATATAAQNWPDPLTYTFDFGDGSTPVSTTNSTYTHTYTAKGSYRVTVTTQGTGAQSRISQKSFPVTVTEPGPLTPAMKINLDRAAGHGPLSYRFDLTGTTSPWALTTFTIDYGDGTQPVSGTGGPLYIPGHTYQRTGDFTVTATLGDSSGRTATISQPLHVAYPADGFTQITPTREVDTRLGKGSGGSNTTHRLGPGQSVTVYSPVATGGNPDALVLNVTAVGPSGAGFLTAYPAGSAVPQTSNLNFTPGQTVPNLVTVPVGDLDGVTITNPHGSVDVVVDVLGYYQSGTGERFSTTAPTRLLDTRTGPDVPVGPDSVTSIQVRGANGVPDNATAAVLNLTATGPDSDSYLTAYASGTARPGTSNVNFTAGQTVANQVVVPIGADGKVAIYNHVGSTHVVADLAGYYSPTGDALFNAVSPTRLVDTRGGTQPLGPDATLTLPVGGANGVPADATAAVLNATSTESDADSFFSLYPHGIPRPNISSLNFTAGQTVANHVTVPLGTAGSVDLYNHTGRSQAVVDLFGYFAKP